MTRACCPLYIQCWPMAEPAYGAYICSAGAAEAAALTTTVYSMAPCSSRVATISATVEAFCPMAT